MNNELVEIGDVQIDVITWIRMYYFPFLYFKLFKMYVYMCVMYLYINMINKYI